MKKILRLIRSLLIITAWTFLFSCVFRALFIAVWNFDFTSDVSWSIMREYWNRGGIIKSPMDIALFVALALLPIFWFIGLRKALKVNYLQFIISPLEGLRRLFNEKSFSNERVVIRNLKSSQQRAEEIKEELTSMKPAKAESSQNIRTQIRKKRSDDE